MNIEMKLNLNTKLIKEIEEQSKNQILEEVGNEILDKIQPKIPVDTGNLYSHTGFDVVDGDLEFYADTPYAEAIDRRTHFMEEVEFADYEGMIAERIREMIK